MVLLVGNQYHWQFVWEETQRYPTLVRSISQAEDRTRYTWMRNEPANYCAHRTLSWMKLQICLDGIPCRYTSNNNLFKLEPHVILYTCSRTKISRYKNSIVNTSNSWSAIVINLLTAFGEIFLAVLTRCK